MGLGDLHTKPMLKENHICVFTDIARNGIKISYAYLTPKAAYDTRFEKSNPSMLKEITEYNLVATYLPITHQQIIDFTKDIIDELARKKAAMYAPKK